jgi:flagellar hook-associated protein 1 FlgK
MDKRDLALDQLAALTGSVSFNQKNGEVVVSIGGHALVVGQEALKLRTQPNTTDSSIVDMYWEDGQKFAPPSGKLRGTLEVRDQVLVDQLNGLNTFANGLITQVNTLHRTGFGLNNATGLDFFEGNNASNIAVNRLLDGASIATSSGTNQAGNSDIALQIAGLKTAKGMKAGTATLNEFYNSQISDLDVTTRRA